MHPKNTVLGMQDVSVVLPVSPVTVGPGFAVQVHSRYRETVQDRWI